MQIATSLFYDRSAKAMNALSKQADALQTQISTGKKFAAPSSDSAAYQRLAGIARDTADDKAYAANLTTAASVLKQSDTTLSAITDQLQRASELTVQARNGTLNDAARKAIGVEIASIVDSIASLANVKDLRGQPIFGGADGGPAAVKQPGGGYVLATTSVSPVPIGDGQTVQANESASRVLSAGGKDTLAVLGAIAAALQSDSYEPASLDTALDDLNAATEQVSTIQASLGARASRVDLETARLKDVAVDREDTRQSIEGTDITTSITELQKTMTILSATQASFSKLSALSLFDYLR